MKPVAMKKSSHNLNLNLNSSFLKYWLLALFLQCIGLEECLRLAQYYLLENVYGWPVIFPQGLRKGVSFVVWVKECQ